VLVKAKGPSPSTIADEEELSLSEDAVPPDEDNSAPEEEELSSEPTGSEEEQLIQKRLKTKTKNKRSILFLLISKNPDLLQQLDLRINPTFKGNDLQEKKCSEKEGGNA